MKELKNQFKALFERIEELETIEKKYLKLISLINTDEEKDKTERKRRKSKYGKTRERVKQLLEFFDKNNNASFKGVFREMQDVYKKEGALYYDLNYLVKRRLIIRKGNYNAIYSKNSKS